MFRNKLLQYCLLGPDVSKWPEIEKQMSPLYQVKDGQNYPPFLLFHEMLIKLFHMNKWKNVYAVEG